MVEASTTLTEEDYKLLVEYARKRNTTLADVMREAISTLIHSQGDLREFPLAREPSPPPSARPKREQQTADQGKSLWEKI